MKPIFLFLSLVLISLLFQNCKKDDSALTNAIYGIWKNNTSSGYIARDRSIYYKFSKPNDCTYYLEGLDGTRLFTLDSMTFNIMDSRLYLYKNDGSLYKTCTIDKLTPSTLTLDNTKFKR